MQQPSSPLKLLVLVGAGLLAAFLGPPQAIESADWRMLCLFATTVLGVLWQPYPLPAIILFSLALGSALGVISVGQALDGYSAGITWIIVSAFLFARAFIQTGLGRRIALLLIRRLGKSSLRLGYSLAITDLILAPATASNTARAGGIVFPVARSLSQEFGSHPGETARKIGSYLLFTSYQANVVTSATFLTAMAANALSVRIALDTAGVEITWQLWFAAASLPAALSLAGLPWLIHRTYPPELKETPEARRFAQRELDKMGPPSPQENRLGVVFIALALTWGSATFHGVSTLSAALLAVSALVFLEVLDVDDIVAEKAAWSTLIWFGGMLSLAGALSDGNLIPLLIESLKGLFSGGHGLITLIVLALVYFYIHYGFVSMTAQIVALYGAFLAIALAAGAPPLLSALILCFFSNLYASTTHYGDGAAPIFFGSGYIDQRSWWRVGFYISVFNIGIWLGVGLPWWKILGIW